MKCCICGPVKNCGPYLWKVLQNAEKIGSLFEDYTILIYYDTSSDNTLSILKAYQKTNLKCKFYVNRAPTSKFRTHNIAKARNFCLQYVKENKDLYPVFIMMDFDDVNCKEVRVDVLQNYLDRNDWDGLSFNTSPLYYDIWGLSIYPYCFSYNHFHHNTKYYTIMQKYVTTRLQNLPPNGLLPCISSFNGFSIYRTDKFLNTYYDGKVRTDLIPARNMVAHKKATGSGLVFKQYVTVDGRFEDCEHRAFHIQARQKDGARIMIAPDILFQ